MNEKNTASLSVEPATVNGLMSLVRSYANRFHTTGTRYAAPTDWEALDRAWDAIHDYAQRLATSTPPVGQQTEGWKLVPIKPTMAMLEAAYSAFQMAAPSLAGFNAKERAYAAMLQHVPPAPVAASPAVSGVQEEAAKCPKCNAGNPVMECDCGHRWEASPGAAAASPDCQGAPKLCKCCEGEGAVHTGIDEAPTTLCDKCGGTGIEAAAGKLAGGPTPSTPQVDAGASVPTKTGMTHERAIDLARECGAVNTGNPHPGGKRFLMSGDDIAQLARAIEREVNGLTIGSAASPDKTVMENAELLRAERQAVVDWLDEYIPPNAMPWDAVNEIRNWAEERRDGKQG